jgi:hypothetical protein
VVDMNRKFYNIKDFEILPQSKLYEFSSKREFIKANEGARYDVFLSHSTEDKDLIKKIRDTLENTFHISVYIDWDEDAGTPRDEIANVVKDAMNKSESFLVVKTDNSDDSSWVPWETGYFDNIKADRIGVLLVEDENKHFNHKTFLHREYLKNYVLLGPDDIIDFIKTGSNYIREKLETNKNIDPPFAVKKPEILVKPHKK